MSDIASCSVDVTQPGFYVSDINALVSSVVPLIDDPIIRTLPEEVVLWDSTVTFEPEFSNIVISAIPPPAFDPDPWSGNEQDLYTPELSMGISFPSAIYDPSINLTFPGGFLKPAPPIVTYNVEPYIPPLNLDIPPLSLPDISFPYLALPDMDITNVIRRVKALHRVNINFISMCMSASVGMADDGRTENIDIRWTPPDDGAYVVMVVNGRCVLRSISPC